MIELKPLTPQEQEALRKKRELEEEERRKKAQEEEAARRAEEARKKRVCQTEYKAQGFADDEEKERLCDDHRNVAVMNKSASVSIREYFSCVAAVKPRGAGSRFWTDCADNYSNGILMGAGFAKCWTALAPFPGVGPFEQYGRCINETAQKAILGSTFGACADRLKPIEPSGSEIISKCVSGGASEIAAADFPRCHAKVTARGMQNREGIRLCMYGRSKDGVNSGSFDGCYGTLRSFNVSGDHMIWLCSDSRINHKLASGRGKSCLDEMQKVVYKNYIHYAVINEASGEGERRITEALKDCEAGKMGAKLPTQVSPHVSLVREFNINSLEQVDVKDVKGGRRGVTLGGISGLSYDDNSKLLYMLSDANPINGSSEGLPPRMYQMLVSDEASNMSFSEAGITFFTGPGQKRLSLDSEGLGRMNNGNSVVSSELDNLAEAGGKGLRFINVFDSDGKFIRGIELPESFSKDLKKGASVFDHNRGIESLSISPSENYMFIGTEGTLPVDEVKNRCSSSQGDPEEATLNLPFTASELDPSTGQAQDALSSGGVSGAGSEPVVARAKSGPQAHTAKQPRQRKYGKPHAIICAKEKYSVRLVRYVRSEDDFKVDSEYRYELEDVRGNGLSEVLALNDNTLLTLERGWDPAARKVTARIFVVQLKKDENSISTAPGAKPFSDQPALKKNLLLDLDRVREALGPGFKNIDNLEAMTIGPKLQGGRRTVIVASDNNFSRGQRTQILVLSLSQEFSDLIK